MDHPSARSLSRRRLLRQSLATSCGLLWAARGWGQEAAALPPHNRFGRMLHEWYADRLRELDQARRARLATVTTREAAAAYVAEVRRKIRDSFGPFPERTPLNPRVSGIVDRDTYTIEKVTFESRPEFFVTANLYVPKGRTGPFPGVVGSCGHSVNGKAAEAYQSFAQGLARQGYVTLIFDPIGQGERLQYPTPDAVKSTIGAGVLEHLHVGNPQFLLDEFFGSWRAWDGIRALDYLLTRPEVDPRHVGLTGNSGGGTMTMWLTGLDERWTMVAPSCAVTTFHHNFHNELPADTEQCPPRVLALGLDHGDFLAALAPKPVIILAQERDFFDVRGSEATYRELKPIWELLGAGENLQLHIGPDPHGYSLSNREAMYRFFHRQTGNPASGAEPTLVIEPDQTLWVMPRGQVVDVPSKTVQQCSVERGRELAAARPAMTPQDLAESLRRLLKLNPVPAQPEVRILRPASGRKYPTPHAATYAVTTEPGIEAVVLQLHERSHLSRPLPGGPKCLLYVSHHSADAELREAGWLRDRIHAALPGPVFACDLRGVGDSRPTTCGGPEMYLNPYGTEYFYAAHGLMIDRPLVGQRTDDLLAILQWLEQYGYREVEVVANGWGTLPATFAALQSPRITRLALHERLETYASILADENDDWPLSSYVPGILRVCDLPDLYQAVGPRLVTP